MTCEIAIMNKHAVALAADSATTVSRWKNGEEEVRYFKGANKIFQLSTVEPVGAMIYASADLQRAPWEILIKDFRAKKGRKKFRDLDGYASELFEFIKNHTMIFPPEYISNVFVQEVESAAIRLIHFEILQVPMVRDAPAGEKVARIREAFDRLAEATAQQDYKNNFNAESLNAAIAGHREALEERIGAQLGSWDDLLGALDVQRVIHVAAERLFKRYDTLMSDTGVVLAGYGEHDYFPKLVEYKCFGNLAGHFLFEQKRERTTSIDKGSDIVTFATTSMVDTFELGFSEDIFTKSREAIAAILAEFHQKMQTDHGATAVPDFAQYVEQCAGKLTGAMLSVGRDNHSRPLREVVGALPVDEMAELAETLIMLQSLKEKVTRPSQSVGGPIDVALISRSDGFVWIKRKHYFKPDLNPRFLARQRDVEFGGG